MPLLTFQVALYAQEWNPAPGNILNWYLNGVKRFITNGCGEVLLTLARSRLGAGLGLNVVGINRGGRTLLAPGPGETIRPHDDLIVEGRPGGGALLVAKRAVSISARPTRAGSK